MAGFARVEYDPYVPRPRQGPDEEPVHVYLSIGDHLGSTSVVIDAGTSEVVEKATFLSHGAIESDYRPTRWQGFREEYKFTGKEEDVEVGLTYFGARYYHARLQRFASPDPLTVHGVAGDLNPYAYVSGRTMSHVDPWGLDKTKTHDGGTYTVKMTSPDDPVSGDGGAAASGTADRQAGNAGTTPGKDSKPSIAAKVAEQVLGHTVPFRVKRIVDAAGQNPKAGDVAKSFVKERLKNPYKMLAEVAPQTKPLLAVVEAGLDKVAPDGANGGTSGEKLGKELESAQLFYVTTLLSAAGDPVAERPQPVTPGLKAGPAPGSGTHRSGPAKGWATGAEPNSKWTQTSGDGTKAVQNTVYDSAGRAVGQVDFKQHGPGAPPGHGHSFPPGQPGAGHGPGASHIPPNQVPPGWATIPTGTTPAQK